MAECNNIKNSELVHVTTRIVDDDNNKYQTAARRKFEKFRTKLIELFFTSTSNTIKSPSSFSSSPVNYPHNESTVSQNVQSYPVLLDESLPIKQQKRRKSSSSTNASSTASTNFNFIESVPNTMLISNCYYGYKTKQIENDNDANESQICFSQIKNKKFSAKKNKGSTSKEHQSKNSINNFVTQSFSSSDSSSSSIITDEIEPNSCSSSQSYRNSSKNTNDTNGFSYPVNSTNNANRISCCFNKPTGMILIDSNYDSFSLNTNSFDFYQNETHPTSSQINETTQNPFLNNSLTNLISFNSELSLLDSYFEASLHLIDDQDNFFDIDFMTNYISYILLKKIKTSANFLKQKGYDFKLANDDLKNESQNLLKKISREIFIQSETEPCGLKGCKISIYFEETEEINHLLSQFRFDATSSLTTFELSLIIKKDMLNNSHLIGLNNTTNNRVQVASASSPFATLTRRILNRNKSKTVDNELEPTSETNIAIMYLNPCDYVLLKFKLY